MLTYLQLWYHLVDNILHGTVSTQAGERMSLIYYRTTKRTLCIAL